MTGLAADPISKMHDTGWGHPECAERFDAVMAALTDAGLMDKVERLAVTPATMKDLLQCHTADYLALAQREIEAGADGLSTGDTVVCPESWKAALHAAGAGIAAVEAVLAGRVNNAFCVVRPPGHHATSDTGMGFCILNNIAIAARAAREKVGRVAIIDWDVHHGNGTQDIFYEDESVLFCSVHQSPLYPGTGAAVERGRGEGEGTTLNFPVRAGAGMAEIGGIFRDELLPAVERFAPELILISAGFDSRVGDPLGSLCLTDEDFAELTRMIREVADRVCDGRVVSMLEGGYNLEGLGLAAAAHLKALIF